MPRDQTTHFGPAVRALFAGAVDVVRTYLSFGSIYTALWLLGACP